MNDEDFEYVYKLLMSTASIFFTDEEKELVKTPISLEALKLTEKYLVAALKKEEFALNVLREKELDNTPSEMILKAVVFHFLIVLDSLTECKCSIVPDETEDNFVAHMYYLEETKKSDTNYRMGYLPLTIIDWVHHCAKGDFSLTDTAEGICLIVKHLSYEETSKYLNADGEFIYKNSIPIILRLNDGTI